MGLNQLATDSNRMEVLSSVLVRASDPVTLQALQNAMADDQRLYLEGKREVDYYQEQTNSAEPVKFLGLFVAVIMAVGSCFAAMNTMYAAVARRSREIGTLRVLGFSGGSILLAFVIESLLLSPGGRADRGAAGIAAAWPGDRHRQQSHLQRDRFRFSALPRPTWPWVSDLPRSWVCWADCCRPEGQPEQAFSVHCGSCSRWLKTGKNWIRNSTA